MIDIKIAGEKNQGAIGARTAAQQRLSANINSNDNYNTVYDGVIEDNANGVTSWFRERSDCF